MRTVPPDRAWRVSVRRSLIPLAALLLGASAPAGHDVAAGDTVEVGGNLVFYFRTGPDNYRFLDGPTAPIIADPTWSASEGLTLEDQRLGINSASISWHVEGGGKRVTYTAQGYRIEARATVRVAPDATRGEKVVTVRLPGLGAAAAELGAEIAEGADTPSDLRFARPDTIVVATVVVHSAVGRAFARVRGFIVPTILALVFLVFWLVKRRPRPA